jgi:sulfite reductase (ferredoxin)
VELSKVERVKAQSGGLRGTIAQELAAPTERFAEDDVQLLKFHGIYQQEDRDQRSQQREAGVPKAHSFMVRTKNPGGYAPGAFYLAIDELAGTYANDSIRITTRQGLQLHGVHKSELKEVIATIDESVGSTLGACGDVNRNVLAPAAPFAMAPYRVAREAAHAIADLLTPRTRAYYEIWHDGELAHSSQEPESDPIYREVYLPRKFKIAVAVPGDNSVDVLTNDISAVPIHSEVEALLGYDLYVGGGLGMTHRKPATFPRLADEFGFCEPADLLPFVRAIVEVQRDYGDRADRKHARLKYTIADRGLAWFRSEVERYAGKSLQPFRDLPSWEHRDYLGWHEQGDGRFFVGLSVENGRIVDTDDVRFKSALRTIVSRYALDLVFTPQQNVLLTGIPRSARATIEAILIAHGVRPVEEISLVERLSMACPALPTCGLALAEAERSLPSLIDALETRLAELGLAEEPISIRMTGCPNGCARPYMSEIGIVGVSADRYNVYLGGSTDSTRLNVLYREMVASADIAPLLDPLFVGFAGDRSGGESFGSYCLRVLAAVSEKPVPA